MRNISDRYREPWAHDAVARSAYRDHYEPIVRAWRDAWTGEAGGVRRDLAQVLPAVCACRPRHAPRPGRMANAGPDPGRQLRRVPGHGRVYMRLRTDPVVALTVDP